MSDEEDITIERRARVPLEARQPAPTRRLQKIDPELLALARGEASIPPAANDPPYDPFGGLIPVDDDGNPITPVEPEPFVLDEPGHDD